jgi:flagellar biosynthesis/type III secretory pathway M-ring protein FliF/YscJ
MLDIMTAIPPIHPTTATSSDVMFWAMIGLLVVLFLVATILWIVGSRRIAQRQSQVKEAGWQYEAAPQPQGDEQPQDHSRQEEILLRR